MPQRAPAARMRARLKKTEMMRGDLKNKKVPPLLNLRLISEDGRLATGLWLNG
jgi:hypothetical protein